WSSDSVGPTWFRCFSPSSQPIPTTISSFRARQIDWEQASAMATERPNTERKALAINLEQRRYGTFAEIGAGQEVVRWFFRVGGAAGTIAKSMSAYDMAVS